MTERMLSEITGHSAISATVTAYGWLCLDRSGQVVHEAVIPDRRQPAIEFFFVREEEPMENEDDDNS